MNIKPNINPDNKKDEMKPASARGILHDIADPELRKIEGEAGKLHALEKESASDNTAK